MSSVVGIACPGWARYLQPRRIGQRELVLVEADKNLCCQLLGIATCKRSGALQGRSNPCAMLSSFAVRNTSRQSASKWVKYSSRTSVSRRRIKALASPSNKRRSASGWRTSCRMELKTSTRCQGDRARPLPDESRNNSPQLHGMCLAEFEWRARNWYLRKSLRFQRL